MFEKLNTRNLTLAAVAGIAAAALSGYNESASAARPKPTKPKVTHTTSSKQATKVVLPEGAYITDQGTLVLQEQNASDCGNPKDYLGCTIHNVTAQCVGRTLLFRDAYTAFRRDYIGFGDYQWVLNNSGAKLSNAPNASECADGILTASDYSFPKN